jgi:deazaflavin-dependent oxidoreductase (nitroreductase family)
MIEQGRPAVPPVTSGPSDESASPDSSASPDPSGTPGPGAEAAVLPVAAGTPSAAAAGPEGDRAHYRAPGWLTRHVFNNLVSGFTRAGISLLGSRVLEVRGRTSGEPRRVPVNLLTFEGRQYLVSARGHGQWVRNVRAAQGELHLLRGRSRTRYHAAELDPAETAPILRAYLERWKAEVGAFFEGVGPDSTDAEIRRIAPRHPVFLLTSA